MMQKYNNSEYLKKLAVYSNNFTEEQLQEYEDGIFGEKIDRKKRVELELARLKKEMGKDLKKYANYYTEISELASLIKVADLSSDILDEAYRIIVRVQLACGMTIRLYSAFTLIREEEEIMALKKKVGELPNGPKFNR